MVPPEVRDSQLRSPICKTTEGLPERLGEPGYERMCASKKGTFPGGPNENASKRRVASALNIHTQVLQKKKQKVSGSKVVLGYTIARRLGPHVGWPLGKGKS